ncbi:MAG: hypothetical protein D6744_18930 [Planctomycetota bacterium]|nr:MAG: hypothetical protein D6744_18930 [Planctomycetota bacterium]
MYGSQRCSLSKETTSRRSFLKLASAAALAGMQPGAMAVDPQRRQNGDGDEGGRRTLELIEVKPALFRPTAHGATIQWITNREVDMKVFVGARRRQLAQVYRERTKGPAAFEIDGFEPGESYFVQTSYRDARTRHWTDSRIHQVRTAPPPGTPFQVALLADSHFERVRRFHQDVVNFRATRTAAIRSLVDFAIFLGDEALVHYIDDDAAAMTPHMARVRWRDWRRTCVDLLESTPSFMVLGNHEGEAGYYRDFRGDDNDRDAVPLLRWGTAARKQYFLNPNHETYPEGGENAGWVDAGPRSDREEIMRANSSPLENYYAWTWGDALFVVLDVNRYTRLGQSTPTDVNQWTLGSDQLRWFERTLAGSSAKWKIVIAHHVLGGYKYDLQGYDYDLSYVYGRGGARYAYVGEQAEVTRLMKKYGAQFFLYGHDHVFAHQQTEGIHYICCGRTTFIQDEWWRTPGWIEAYGSAAARHPNDFYGALGYVRLTVSPASVRVEYLRTAKDRNGAENVDTPVGGVAYCFELTEDGRIVT